MTTVSALRQHPQVLVAGMAFANDSFHDLSRFHQRGSREHGHGAERREYGAP
ncbi:MAG: hypothetical protein ABF296_03285 [Oceanococcaceae bacterium]